MSPQQNKNLKRKPSSDAKGSQEPKKKVFNNKKQGKDGKNNSNNNNSGTQKNFKKNFKSKFNKNDKKNTEKPSSENVVSNTEKFKNKKMNKVLIKEGETAEEQENIQGTITMGQINKLVQKLWNKSTPESEKQKHITQIIKKVEPILSKLVQQREGSRAVQACIKYGSEEQQNEVFKLVLNNSFPETVKSKYGHFLALRMIKQMKSKEVKEQFFQKLHKNAFYLVSHVEGAKVIDQYLRNLAKSSELTAMKKVFEDVVLKSQEQGINKSEKLETIENLALKIIDKSNHYPLISKHILSLSFPVLVEAEREKLIEFLREKVLDLIEDKEGVKLCLDLINYSSAKDRKIIVRNFKDHVSKMILSGSNFAYLIIQKLIHAIDDTVLIEKQILKPIKTEFKEIFENKHGFSIISSIFIPQHNSLKTFEKEIKFTTSKKDDSLRLAQLQENLIGDSVDLLKTYNEEQLERHVAHSRFLSSVLKYILKQNKTQYFDFVKQILNKFVNEQQFKENFAEKSLLNNIDSHRILKNVISLSSELSGEAKEYIDEYLEKLSQIIINNIKLFVVNRSSIYIVIAMIEQTSYKDLLVQKVKQLNQKEIGQQKQGNKDEVAWNILKNLL
ncbi:Armadillo-type fold [Pseudocohnilembus persalinus]|uniref:Armadillo-type fold n=1 Tax=Pseudocohnilembus persalinus TaxID=266149 RepID=A0A0V0QDB9_PSEPJ|nr:Armadillo-type fold [Pseudocohnilembus persalinus]|eukprot:KRX00085.1 Armadillo-type fold [Pseudocohnilembus persalinus]